MFYGAKFWKTFCFQKRIGHFLRVCSCDLSGGLAFELDFETVLRWCLDEIKWGILGLNLTKSMIIIDRLITKHFINERGHKIIQHIVLVLKEIYIENVNFLIAEIKEIRISQQIIVYMCVRENLHENISAIRKWYIFVKMEYDDNKNS